MTITAQADILGAITARLRTFNEVTTLASTRIGGEIGSDWFPGPGAQYAVRLRRTGGIVDVNEQLIGVQRSRIDCVCYGSSGRTATVLMSTVLSALCPDASARGSFIQSVTVATNTTQNVRVYDVQPEVGIVQDREPDTNFYYAWCPLIATWSAIPA